MPRDLHLKAAAVAVALITAGGCHGMDTASSDRANSASGTLADSRWLAEDIDGRPVAAGAQAIGQATVEFQGTDRIAGSTGCNHYSGPVTVGADSFSVGILATTRRACSPPLMSQEQRFTDALTAARRYSIEGATLRLFDASGAERLRLSRSTGQ
ncbi:MAG: META domain-containing protein [Rhodospirillales bacterium]